MVFVGQGLKLIDGVCLAGFEVDGVCLAGFEVN